MGVCRTPKRRVASELLSRCVVAVRLNEEKPPCTCAKGTLTRTVTGLSDEAGTFTGVCTVAFQPWGRSFTARSMSSA